MNAALEGLEPRALWHYFGLISRVPRCSGHEGQVQSAIEQVAAEKGLETRRDEVGNLVVAVPASPGHESAPVVVLQGHVDMVCEKDSNSGHDFATDPIPVVRDGDWITANGTTLGADNGVAVAAALALLDDPPRCHGPLELLFTIDEERGLTGASGIEPHMVEGRILLNMDSEEEGYVTVGCAGGGDTVLELPLERETAPRELARLELSVRGLTGGHSGLDIHRNRANALRCLARTLHELRQEIPGVCLARLEGGSKRNAIPREATACIALPAEARELANTVVSRVLGELRGEFAASDPTLNVELLDDPEEPAPAVLTPGTLDNLLVLLLAIPDGVVAMSRDIPTLVETSSNLGVVRMQESSARLVCCSRSSVASALESVRSSIAVLGQRLGARVSFEASYPGWKPNLESPLLATFQQVHEELLGNPPEIMAIHAGLECGIIGERFAGMDMVSFGPDMKGVHAPGEKLDIASTGRFFSLLQRLLEKLA